MTGPELQAQFDEEAAGLTVRRIRLGSWAAEPATLDWRAERKVLATLPAIALLFAAVWVVLP